MGIRKWLLGLAISAVASTLGEPPASATTVLQVGIPELTRTSEWVVRASVVRVSDVDLRSAGKGLYTDVELKIQESYRGAHVPETYVLRLLGGTGKDGVSMRIPGMPAFTAGEEVVLFLEKTSLGHIPCGLGQGVWRVVTAPDGTPWVTQAVGGLYLMRRNPQGHLIGVEPTLWSDARRLTELAADVYAAQLEAVP
jgi:hypothetical protein